MIEVDDLACRFGDFEAVKGISFRVAPGEIFAFLGPNGAGKTTTIKMLTTLLRPTRGSIRIDGLDPGHPAARGAPPLRHRVPGPEPGLAADGAGKPGIARCAVQRAARGTARAHREADEAVRAVGQARPAHETYSGGMKRRLEIVRGFLHTPKVLFLDEPTLGLDPQSRHQLWNHVRTVNQSEGITVFLTTHYMDEAERVAQRIAIVDHGRIVALGTLAELKTADADGFARGRVPEADGHCRARRDGGQRRCHAPDDEGLAPMNAIYVLWLRALKQFSRSQGADRLFGGPATAVPAGTGFRVGPGVPASRAGQLHPVHRAGRDHA